VELNPHISRLGCRLLHTGGRSSRPKIRQRLSSVNWAQRSPAGFPRSMPGIGEEMDGAMQQAAQPMRHSISEYGLTAQVARPGRWRARIPQRITW